ncbi:MAG: tRNA (adenosine(37)-N6)-dimethylallyltransferase MiaA [Mariniphaga sp.]
MITILGPTASGKTALAARLAFELDGEVISADSRQVYRGMDIGTGKDYSDNIINGTQVPVHLIDLAAPGYEYNIFEYQCDFLNCYHDLLGRKKLPVLCGGSGMYLESVLKGYRLAKANTDDAFLTAIQGKPDDQLVEILKSYKTPHNITDFEDRPRLLKAIMVAHAAKKSDRSGGQSTIQNDVNRDFFFPKIDSDIFGISYPRALLMNRISERLAARLETGMIQEVETLLLNQISPEQLMKYGLEYKFVTLFLTRIMSYNDMFEKLNIAIRQFAKRQMTWFRRMERQGLTIHWIDGQMEMADKVKKIRQVVNC